MARPSPRLTAAVALVVLVLTAYACEHQPTRPQTLPGVTITVTPDQLSLNIGASASLNATVTDLAGRVLSDRVVQWSSSAPDIVAVSETGVVTALDVGSASIGAYSDQGVGFARVVVPLSFQLPLRGPLVLTEIGTPTSACPGNEGGLRVNGARKCSHSGISRYSLDLTDPELWAGGPSGDAPPEVRAAADGIIASVCVQPAPITCGPDGPYMVIEHPGGYLTIYSHLLPESVTLRRKTAVTRGQPLGTIQAGRADPGPWLHFEVRHNNQGASAASVLDAVDLGGRKFGDYKAGEVYR
jgi:murein DD-endopeptidase MepM/ murein hydrolase activator NlpD